MTGVLLSAIVLLDIKQVLNNAFSGYMLPVIGACMAIGFGYMAISNWKRYRDDLMAGLLECGTAMIYGLLVGAVLVGLVEGFKAIKISF
jgi:hypothetical protein